MYALLLVTEMSTKLDCYDLLTLMLSALCHDLDHPGYNNTYQVLLLRLLLQHVPGTTTTTITTTRTRYYSTVTVTTAVFSLLHHCFANFWRNLWNSNGFCSLFIGAALTRSANTPLDRSAALVLSVCVINCMYCSCICIHQIQLEIWPVLDLPGFL